MTRFLILITLVILGSCSKPSNDHMVTGLLIDLKESVINVNQIDSADVVFRKVGTGTRVKQRFIKSAQHLQASLHGLTAGTWNADIEVYTKTVNHASNQYVTIKPILIEEKLNEVRIAGPGSQGWLKRHVKSSPNREVVVIVPDEVYDSFFELRSTLQEPFVVGIQREAININYQAADEAYACNNACFKDGRLSDNTYFMHFAETILSNPWTRNEISISVLNDKLEELLYYERTWTK